MRCGKVAIKQCLIEHGKGVRKAFCVRLFSGGGQGVGDQKKRGQERVESRRTRGGKQDPCEGKKQEQK